MSALPLRASTDKTTEDRPKFCVDCRYVLGHPTRTWLGLGSLYEDFSNAKCIHPLVVDDHDDKYLVTGISKATFPCDIERSSKFGPCGADAKLFEPHS